MSMLANMAGITPEKMQAELDAFQSLVSTSHASLGRIEKNTQDNARMLRAICAKLEIEVHDDGSNCDGGTGTGDPGGG